jgi:nitroreductase
MDHEATGPGLEGLAAPRPEPARDGAPPDQGALARILELATTGLDRLGDALVEGLHRMRGNDLPEAMVAKMRGKAFAAPCKVVVIASPHPESNVPVWEQVSSASCTGYALVLAATTLGLGAVWKSAAVLDTEPLRALFSLADHERLMGWINLGTPAEPGRKRSAPERPDLSQLVTVIDDGEHPFGSAPAR